MDIDALRETLAEVVDILKVYDVQTSTLISIPCNDVSEFYDAYQYIKTIIVLLITAVCFCLRTATVITVLKTTESICMTVCIII